MSDIRATTISDTAGTGPITLTGQHASKAFSNVTTDAATSGDSFNQSSITDIATGASTHSFTNSFANTNYGHSGSERDTTDVNRSVSQLTGSDATGSCRIHIASDGGTNSGLGYDVCWWGDLA